jgi:alpha-beta hydrolase superfamily lysophospholipase
MLLAMSGRWRRWALIAIGAGLLVLLALTGVAVWLGSSQALFPPWYRHRTPGQGLVDRSGDEFAARVWQAMVSDPLRDLGLPYEDVEFAASDGSTLRGWLVPGARGAGAAVVAVHGGGSDRREFLRQTPIFHGAGWATLLFDCREQGISDGRGRGISLGFRESADVSSAVDFLRSRGFARVAAIGTSQGGASVILAGAADPRIAAVVAENPFTSVRDLFRDNPGAGRLPPTLLDLMSGLAILRMGGTGMPAPIEVVADIAPRPLLLMHGTDDTAIPHEHSRALYARAGQPKSLWIVDGGRHSMLFNAAREEWSRRVLAVLRSALGARPD